MKTLTLHERGRQIQEKIKAGTRVPASSLMMNSGRRRQSKRALLASIEQQRQDAGQAVVVFDARF